MPYTNIAKPTGASYTNVRNGYPLFDDTIVSYDDSATFYDGDNSSSYTNVAKPGFLTWAQATFPWSEANIAWGAEVGYLNVNKPA